VNDDDRVVRARGVDRHRISFTHTAVFAPAVSLIDVDDARRTRVVGAAACNLSSCGDRRRRKQAHGPMY